MSDLYKTEEWKSIPIRERYCLLPTIEGIRPGALVRIKNPQAEALEYCLQEKGMKSHKEGDLWFVAKDEKLLEAIVKKSNPHPKTNPSYPINKEEKKYHKSLGKFFGYPKCCIESFVNTLNNGLFPGREWRNKSKKAFEQGIYDDLFDYRLHVPCKIDCKGTPKLAKKIKKCLESYDPEAAEGLKMFNQKGFKKE